ncbi:DMT family transporter [Salinisphaera sp. Q1T1-3]|uniref:DMT family transporter n=1 Tax=Salinisphaera sp. Q1T1-3 TaxID=2321229 RepID=UPI001F33D173|nr:DMT family transporter [Salinisphaera sp. Q1T1-3]
MERGAVGGLGWIVLSAVLLALADALVKWLSDTLSVWQLVTLRALVALPLLGGVMCLTGIRRRDGCRPVWVGVRSLLLVAMWLLVYLALTGLPLPAVSAALYSAPLWITLLYGLRRKRRLHGFEVGAVVIGFCGVLILLRPGTSAFSAMFWLPLAGAVLYALAAMLTATYCHDESPLVLALGLQLGFLGVGLAGLVGLSAWPLPPAWQQAAPFIATGWHPLTSPGLVETAALIAGLAVIAVVASAAMARAYQVAPAPLVAAGDYSYLAFSALWSLWLFGQTPDGWGALGIGLIVCAGLCAVRGRGDCAAKTRVPVRRARLGPGARS